jgi:hypothetical protein
VPVAPPLRFVPVAAVWDEPKVLIARTNAGLPPSFALTIIA